MRRSGVRVPLAPPSRSAYCRGTCALSFSPTSLTPHSRVLPEIRKRKSSSGSPAPSARKYPSILSLVLVERRKAPASERVREGLSAFLGIPLREAFDDEGLAI